MDLGIDLGNGIAKASVFMDVDISGTVDMQLNAGPAGTTTAPTDIGSGSSTPVSSSESGKSSPATVSSSASGKSSPAPVSSSASGQSSAPVSSSASGKSSSAPARSKSTSVKPTTISKKPSPPKPTHKALKRAEAVSGCVNVTGAIAVNGGLDGALKPLFNDAITFPIFQTSKPLFNVSRLISTEF
jgi:hypothetical protein